MKLSMGVKVDDDRSTLRSGTTLVADMQSARKVRRSAGRVCPVAREADELQR